MADSMNLDSRKRKRLIKLSWDLIAYKLYYYYPEKVHASWHNKLDIPDSEYDKLEAEYLQLCSSLDIRNTVAGKDDSSAVGSGMTQLDFTRPSVQLAENKYKRRRLK